MFRSNGCLLKGGHRQMNQNFAPLLMGFVCHFSGMGRIGQHSTAMEILTGMFRTWLLVDGQ